ncbi:hypothetical protein ACJX0J_038047, partial [Zea mays]
SDLMRMKRYFDEHVSFNDDVGMNQDEEDPDDRINGMVEELYTAEDQDKRKSMFGDILEEMKQELYPGATYTRFSFDLGMLKRMFASKEIAKQAQWHKKYGHGNNFELHAAKEGSRSTFLDTINARLDLEDMGIRRHLHLKRLIFQHVLAILRGPVQYGLYTLKRFYAFPYTFNEGIVNIASLRFYNSDLMEHRTKHKP